MGVVQLAANGKSTLVPVAILVGAKFWDATAYKADPIPMALETGTVYEAERAGTSMGLFTVSSALHSNSANVPSPWIGTGAWLPAGSEKAKASLKAETTPVGIDTSDQPPRLTRDPQKVTLPPAPTAPPSAPPQSTAPSSGDEPPRLSKGTPPPEPAPPAGSNPPSQGQPGQGSSAPPAEEKKPSDAKPDSKQDDRANIPASDSGASEGSRPTLRRGKPVGSLPEDEVPGYSKPGAVASAAAPANAGKAVETPADKGPVQLLPAISDASGPDPRSFGFTWLKDEEGERRQQMATLAKEQIRAYVDARAKARLAPKPAGAQGAGRASAAKTSATASARTSKTKDPILDNVQMTAFDLWGNNQPVLVFSAEAHIPPPPAGAAFSAVDSELQYSILLVAFPDTYNNLHKIYAGVTDKYHLDLTPRLELVDAVDADGDLRGELLFRETSDNGTGWVIYRASQDKLWKLFDSLHPE